MKEEVFLEGQKIIVAEDDQNSFYLLEFLLDMYGAEIIHTVTGEETIQALHENPDVCLILMDIKMPGMNGLESTKKIREFNRNIPIIAQTALMFPGEKKKILEAGCNDYVLKPIEQDVLLGKIKQLLDVS